MAGGGSKRPVWKGDIAFGLVNIPITLYPGSSACELDFDLIDKRDMAPVGYRRINKRTGKEITEDNIVKGYRYEDDQYVIMSDEDFKQANAEATQTVDIHHEHSDTPAFYTREVDGKTYTIVDEWCSGFLQGIRLTQEAWQPC